MAKPLDSFDIALLNRLQRDSIATADALAEHVPLSPSAIARRVRRLRAEGIIAADVALISTEIVQDRLQAIVHVQLHEHAQHRGLSLLRERLMRAPEVQICLEISGTSDLMVVTITRGMSAFNAFADEVFAANPVVRRYETSFVKKSIKASLSVELDEDDAC